MKMPWGKHAGKEIEDLPTDYLKWLAENCDDEDICEAADEEYRYRKDHD
jgi:Putative quorum-sensing-regulated virulence factor